MGLGCVAVFPHIQVHHHGFKGVGDGGGMAPGVLRVEKEVVLGGAGVIRVFFIALGIQPPAEVIPVLGLPIVLHRVGGGAYAVGPPVVQVAAVNRRVL